MHRHEIKETVKLPEKVKRALHYCDNPYLLKPVSENRSSAQDKLEQIGTLKKAYARLDALGSSRFYLSRLYATLQNKCFDNSIELIDAINLIQTDEQKVSGCLQKALCVAKLSKSFNKGVVFIGALLPVGQMHAWVIEDDIQPDIKDRGWINYRPLLAISEE